MFKKAVILALVLLLSPAASVVSQELKKISLGYPSLAFTPLRRCLTDLIRYISLKAVTHSIQQES
jgi:hypothetical protein